MDYEKMYKEALERAKRLTSDMTTLQKIREFIFPELAESEDERIRKAIQIALSLDDAKGYLRSWGISYEQADAFLERQKEQKQDEGDFTIYHPLKNAKGEYECIPYSFYGSLTSFSEDKDLFDFLRTCFYTEEECNEWIKLQKEQEPAPFSCGHENGKPLDNWKPSEEQMEALTEEETPAEKERRRLKGYLKEEVCASDVCAYRGKNVCTVKRDEYCPMFKAKEEKE